MQRETKTLGKKELRNLFLCWGVDAILSWYIQEVEVVHRAEGFQLLVPATLLQLNTSALTPGYRVGGRTVGNDCTRWVGNEQRWLMAVSLCAGNAVRYGGP